MTLPELLVAMAILSLVLTVFLSVMASVQRSVAYQDKLSQTLDQARLGIEQLDREIRSGNVLYDPANENSGVPKTNQSSCQDCLHNYTLRVYTQANAPSRGGYVCTLWQIDLNQQLLTRQWAPEDPTQATPWRVVATGIVNRALNEPAFVLDPDPMKGGRTVDVTLAVNSDPAKQQTVRIRSSLTGRNTTYGYPANICSKTPSG